MEVYVQVETGARGPFTIILNVEQTTYGGNIVVVVVSPDCRVSRFGEYCHGSVSKASTEATN